MDIKQKLLTGLGIVSAVAVGIAAASWDEDRSFLFSTGVAENQIHRDPAPGNVQPLEVHQASASVGVLDTAAVLSNTRALDTRIDKLESMMAELIENQTDLANTMIDLVGRDNSEVAQPSPPISVHEQALREDAYAEQQATHIEQTVLAEPIDAGWAAGAQDTLETAFAQESLKDFVVTQLDCRSTLCRVEVDINIDAAGPDAFRALQENAPWDGAGFVQISQDPPKAVLFLAREGASIPELEPSSAEF